MTNLLEERCSAIHLLRAGHSMSEVARQLERHPNWVRKWQRRYETEGWAGLQERSRAPKQHSRKTSTETRQAICQARSELEAEAGLGTGLKYIGARAVRTKLKGSKKEMADLPSRATIERVLRAEGLTRAKSSSTETSLSYPHLQPTQPHQLCQVDIVPHYLPGGQKVACFNGLDVVSRYPTGQPFARRRAQDAAEFLVHQWQTVGIAQYTQVDNEGCFSGGATHPYVLGTVVRLALRVGTELLFSPFYHPKSNGTVERFHQDYDLHVWQGTYLADQEQLQRQGEHFFQLYRDSAHHSALAGQTPQQLHTAIPATYLPPDFHLPETKLPLYEGRIHFMRAVQAQNHVLVLNSLWLIPQPQEHPAVWVTLELRVTGATLSVYDAAPDCAQRTCLVAYPFPVSEPILPHPQPKTPPAQENFEPAPMTEPTHTLPELTLVLLPQHIMELSQSFWWSTLTTTAQFARQVVYTIY
jgi:transposase